MMFTAEQLISLREGCQLLLVMTAEAEAPTLGWALRRVVSDFLTLLDAHDAQQKRIAELEGVLAAMLNLPTIIMSEVQRCRFCWDRWPDHEGYCLYVKAEAVLEKEKEELCS